MRFVKTKKEPLEGGLNVNVKVIDQSGNAYLKRHPKIGDKTLKAVAYEYYKTGFTDSGGKFRIRNAEEQTHFIQRASRMGLQVLPPAYTDEKGVVYYRFLEGAKTLDQFLSHATDRECDEVLCALFSDLHTAHSKNIIYGDRWPKNILIIPQKTRKNTPAEHSSHTFVHIDFDLEISGPTAREFELAQVVYYVVCAGREKVLKTLPQLLATNNINVFGFNFKMFAIYLEKHAEFFHNDKEYGNAEKEIGALLAAIRTLKNMRQ